MVGLHDLEDGLIARCWPEERVLAGLRVCKAVRLALRHAESALLEVSEQSTVILQLRQAEVPRSSAADFLRLIQWLKCPTTIHQKPFSCSKVYDEICMALISAMGLGWSNLTSLQLEITDAKLAIPLIEGLRIHRDLRHVKLFLPIGCRELKELGTAMQGWQELRTLDLSFNTILDEGLLNLVEGLPHCTKLQGLKLQSCGVTFEGIRHLGPALRPLTSLQVLRIPFNALGDSGIYRLSRDLKHSQELRRLDFGYCSLGDRGMRGLVMSCLTLQLESLDLKGNCFGDEGAGILGAALACLSGLKRLNIASNRFRVRGFRVNC